MSGGLSSKRHLAHEAGIVILGQQRRGLDHRHHQRLQPDDVVLAEILQHMAGDLVLLAGMADTHPHPAIIRPQCRGDGAQAVLPRIAAAGLHLQLAGGQVDLVMDHHQRIQRQLEEAQRRADAVARQVHVGLGLEQIGLAAAKLAFGQTGLRTCAFHGPKL